MAFEIVMPRLSDQMEEATVIQWLKQPGDSVERGDPLVEIETDKATMVYEAEFDGVLEEIVVDEGGDRCARRDDRARERHGPAGLHRACARGGRSAVRPSGCTGACAERRRSRPAAAPRRSPGASRRSSASSSPASRDRPRRADRPRGRA